MRVPGRPAMPARFAVEAAGPVVSLEALALQVEEHTG